MIDRWWQGWVFFKKCHELFSQKHVHRCFVTVFVQNLVTRYIPVFTALQWGVVGGLTQNRERKVVGPLHRKNTMVSYSFCLGKLPLNVYRLTTVHLIQLDAKASGTNQNNSHQFTRGDLSLQ